ncbi:hypothetical protein [Levilactobacillus sp. HBUAS67488]
MKVYNTLQSQLVRLIAIKLVINDHLRLPEIPALWGPREASD